MACNNFYITICNTDGDEPCKHTTHICHCAYKEDGSDGDDGKGDGDDGKGDGDDGKGDGDDGKGDGDDGPDPETEPAQSNITLLGSKQEEVFYGLNPSSTGGYLVCGQSGTDSLIAKYDESFTLVDKAMFVGAENNYLYRAVDTEDGHIVGVGYNYPANFYLAVDAEKTPVFQEGFRDGYSAVTSYNRDLITVPTDFEGPSKFICVGMGQGTGFLAGYDKDYNRVKQITVPGVGLGGVTATKDKVVVVGSANTEGFGGTDGLIAELDPELNALRFSVIGSTGNQSFRCVEKINGGYVIGGTNINELTSTAEIMVLVTDDDFKIFKRALIAGSGANTINSLRVRPKGGYVISGTTTSTAFGGTEAYMAVLDEELNLVKDIAFGHTGSDSAYDALQRSDGTYVVVGGSVCGGAGGSDAFLVTFRGRFNELTGSMSKYPLMQMNGQPGNSVTHDFSLLRNDNPPFTLGVNNLDTPHPKPVTKKLAIPDLLVDPNVVIPASVTL